MNKIFEEIFNKNLAGEEFVYDFEIEQQGVYGVEITASAKSRRQNFISLRSFLRDDDLAVKIDNISFPKKSGKKGLFDSEAAWNGSKLKGLDKTNFFLIKLAPGKHQLNFSIEQSPKLKSISIYQIQGNDISYLPQDNEPSLKSNRAPWLSIILCNLGLQSLKIKASAKEGKKFLFFKRDDSDLKLIINEEIQKNQEPKSHKNWYWCGRTLKGESKIFEKEFNLKPDIYYLELWTDRDPKVEEIKIGIGESDGKEAEEVKKTKRIPTVDNPEWTGNFYDDSEQIILTRVIFGEARNISKNAKTAVAWSVINRVNDPRWGDTYHQVILQKKHYSCFNEGDSNLPYVQNPLLDKAQKDAWRECYEVAGQMINGKLEDPTNGANHYYSDDINAPQWTKVKEAEFKIKIDNLIFYNLKREGNSGKIRISLIILIFLGIILLGGAIFTLAQDSLFCSEIKEQTTDSEHFFIHPIWNEVAVIYFDQNREYVDLRQLTDNGHYKSHLKVFSEGEKFGYFQELHKRDEYFDYQDEQARKEYYDNYLALMIYDLESKTEKEVFRGNNHLGEWEWINDEEVVIYQSCGTECVGFWRIDIETGEKNSGNYGVGYQWSPDKKYLLAYRYTLCGIAVGDKYGNEIFEVMRNESEIFPSLAEKTKAIWSPDSSKFALIIKKDEQEKLEFLAFDVLDNFKIIYQKDLEANDFSDFSWENNGAVFYSINGEIKKVVIK